MRVYVLNARRAYKSTHCRFDRLATPNQPIASPRSRGVRECVRACDVPPVRSSDKAATLLETVYVRSGDGEGGGS